MVKVLKKSFSEYKVNDNRAFLTLPYRVVNERKLSAKAIYTLCVIAGHTNKHNICFIRQETIADIMDTTRQSVNKHIKELCQFGYLYKFKLTTHSCSHYKVVFETKSTEEIKMDLEKIYSDRLDEKYIKNQSRCKDDIASACKDEEHERKDDVTCERKVEVTHNKEPINNSINNESINNNIDSDSNSLNLYNKIINHYNSVLSLKSLNWTKCQSASKNKTVSERLSKELDEFGYDFIIAAIDKLSETKYGVSIAGQGKYPKITLFFILTKLEKINSDGYAEIDKPTSDTSLGKQIHPDVQFLFDLYNSSVEGRAAHSATSITPKLHQDILDAIEIYGIDELKRHIPVVCQNDYFNGENQNNDDGRVWLGSIGYFFREDKIGLIMEDKQYGDPNKVKTPKPKLPKGQQVSDSRFERGLRYFVETGSWDDFSFGPEPKRGLDKRLSKLTDAQYEKYLIAKKQKG